MAGSTGRLLPPAPRQKSAPQAIIKSKSKTAAAPRQKFPKHLIEIYDIKSLLGQGAFSTVWRAVHRGTGQVRAVKKIDTSELSPREIAHEIALMRLLRNPNVVRCYDVFLEGQFVNIVIDIFAGGDLIDGLNAHRRARGRLPDAQLARLCRQMVAAVAHVHGLKIVHRDIKGENFLCNRPDIGDPECQIALADFGTAVRIEQGDQLSGQVGTPPFWAPEVWAGRYAFPADVWAVGVTAYILLAGVLPFEGEEEICKPQVPGKSYVMVPSYATHPCADFIGRCLTKDAQSRPAAAQMARHAWMSTPPAQRGAPDDDGATEGHSDDSSDPLGRLLDGVGAVVEGCCSGLGVVLDVLISAMSTEKVVSITKAPSGGSAAGSSGQASLPDAEEMEKQVTELSKQISKAA